MAKRHIVLENELMEVSEEAKHFWGKAVEDALPRPVITEDPNQMLPSLLLLDMLQYARGAESRGEWLFRKNYLHPIFKHYAEHGTNVSWEEDDMGNMYVQVGDINGVLHVGHIDTVHADDHSPLQEITVDAKGIVTLDAIAKNSFPVLKEGVRWVDNVDVRYAYPAYELPAKKQRCLGADDACALATMIYLIAHGVSGTYVFTRGEEIGCVGTKFIIANELIEWSQYMVAVEVDRKGTTEIIGKMSPGITASQSFVASLAEQLGMNHVYSDKGSITDVGHMAKFIPECVNIAAGYNLQHSERENTDINYLDKLGAAMLTVDWDALVIERAAGEYYKPVTYTPAKPYTPKSYSNPQYNQGSGYVGNANSYGDYTKEPSSVTTPYDELVGSIKNKYMRENYIRNNAAFITEFLLAMNLSPAQMHNVICFGNVDGEPDLEFTEADFELFED